MDLNKIQNLKNQALSSIIEADTKDELERIRIGYLDVRVKLQTY